MAGKEKQTKKQQPTSLQASTPTSIKKRNREDRLQKMILKDSNEFAISKYANKLTVNIARKGVSILSLRKQGGEQAVAQLLNVLINNMNNNININLKLDGDQIPRIAMSCAGEYGSFTLEDYILLFQRIEDGYYGIQMKIDKQIINECKNKYQQEKEDIIYNDCLDKKGAEDNYKYDPSLWYNDPALKDNKIRNLEQKIKNMQDKMTKKWQAQPEKRK